MKNKNGFTLIELLAVIIILGILMIIAVPAVTKYINDSRKNGYISSAKSIISGTTKIANSEELNMTDQDTTYYIPAKYIDTSNDHKTPYGEFKEAYVGVVTDGKSYDYYWISNDTSKQGIKTITNKENLDIDLIEGNILDSDIRGIVETTGIEDRLKIRILNLDGTWQEVKNATKNLNEDGEIEPTDTLLAIFVTGGEFNAKVKALAGDTDPSYNTANTNIEHIKRSKIEPGDEHKQLGNIVSADNSEVPIYAWFDDGTVYWWSEDIKPNLNSNAARMFTNFQGVKDIDLKYIKTNLTTTMQSMFGNCTNLETLDLSRFDTSNVTTMRTMFQIGTDLESKLQSLKGIEKFNTSKVTDMAYMFNRLSKIKNLDVRNFDTSNVTNMKSMFQSLELLEELDISNFDTSKVTDMSWMFNKSKKIKKLDLSNFDTSNVTNMQGMLQNLESLEKLDVSNFNTNKVTDMSWMFNNSKKIKKLDLSNFDTSNVTTMMVMFNDMESLEELDISSFNTSKVTDMSWMFGCGETAIACKLSNIIGLTSFDTSNVTTMQSMFVNQQGLRTLDLSSFNTTKLKNTSYMFLATNLTTIYASSNFDVSGVTSSSNMFSKSVSGLSSSTDYVLTGGQGTTYDSSHVDKEYARLDDPTNNRPGYFTLKTN